MKNFFSFGLVFVLFLMPVFSMGKKNLPPEESLVNPVQATADDSITGSGVVIKENQKAESGAGDGFREDALIKKTGRIVVLGSEPHTYLGFNTDGGESYILDRNSAEIPLEYQGLEMEVTGFANEKAPGIFYVKSFRVLK